MKKTRIDHAFDRLRKSGRKGFVAYLTAGDPHLAATVDIVRRLAAAGADVIELGIPFSDPLADGEANQRAAERALASGTTFAGILDAVREIRRDCEVPLLFFSYLNPLYAHGFESAVARAAEAGVDGMLLVDLALEESAPYRRALRAHGLNFVPLITPTTPEDRIGRIAATGSGFLYAVSREGVTGMQDRLQEQARGLLEAARRQTRLPVALGFGVSTPEQARAYAEMTDAVVVGSYIVKTYHRHGDSAEGRARATDEVATLIRAVKEVCA
jgi:tryptophan synthase alpha chain